MPSSQSANKRLRARLSWLPLLFFVAVTSSIGEHQCAHAKETRRAVHLQPRRLVVNEETQFPARQPFLPPTKAQRTRDNASSRLGLQRAIMDPLRVGFRQGQSRSGGLIRVISTAIIRQTCSSSSSSSSNSQPMMCHNHAITKPSQEPFHLAHLTRGGSQVRAKKRRSKSSSSKTDKPKKKKPDRPSALSASKPFFPEERIGDLTLRDVGKAFEYALKSTREDFNEAKFMDGIGPTVKALFEAIDKATATSRGKQVKAATTGVHQDRSPGDIDTFNFCAAARILSEWRLIRQVPEGSKRYAASMKVGNKDVVQNIGKIEAAAHDWIDHQKLQPASASVAIKSPTLRDLIQFEVEFEHHPALPRLKEISGAMGLLWVRRQLQFQTATFQNLLDIPKKVAGPAEAFTAAYDQVYSNFHSWAVQKVFNYSFKEAPEIHEVYKRMNPRRLKEVMESPDEEDAASSQKGFHLPRLHHTSSAHAETKSEDPSGEESALADDALERRISREMEKDAHEHIKSFVEDIQPMLDDLANLFEEFNANDPKKA